MKQALWSHVKNLAVSVLLVVLFQVLYKEGWGKFTDSVLSALDIALPTLFSLTIGVGIFWTSFFCAKWWGEDTDPKKVRDMKATFATLNDAMHMAYSERDELRRLLIRINKDHDLSNYTLKLNPKDKDNENE